MAAPTAIKGAAAKPVPKYDELPELVTPEQAQAFLQISRTTTYDLIRTKALPSVRFGKLIRIPKTALLGERS